MEDKLKRECKAYVEKVFKKYEKFGSGSIPKDDVKHLLKIIIPEYIHAENAEELNELLANYIKATKYTVHNKQTNQFEVKFMDNTVDFPSVLAVTVHFLKKIELKDVNFFSGQSVVKPKDFGANDCAAIRVKNDQKKKLF